jgi:uncharacterized membrane protein
MFRLPRLVVVVLVGISPVWATNASAQIAPTELPSLPGATSSAASGINSSGQISGTIRFAVAPLARAVVWNGGPPIELSRLCATCDTTAADINETGDVAGSATDSSGVVHPAVWRNGVLSTLPLLSGHTAAGALTINNVGVLAGQSRDASGVTRPVLWANGGVEDLAAAVPGLMFGIASSINDAGQVVGTIQATEGSRAFAWNGGILTLLETPSMCGSHSNANGNNELGHIVGTVVGADCSSRAAVWEDGVLRILPVLPRPPVVFMPAGGMGHDISDSGDVVGGGGLPAPAALWRNGIVVELQALGSYLVPPASPTAIAFEINERGVAVGWSNGATDSIQRAVSWRTIPNAPPTVSVPAGIVAQAATADGVAVTFTATATDNEDGGLTPECAPASGTTFIPGVTTVTCVATDADGATGSAAFQVVVRIDNLLAQLAANAATIAALQSELTAANSTVAVLQAAVSQVSNSIESIRAELAATLRQPSFTIPGSTPQQKSAALSQAIQGLNPLSQLELFLRLGGRLRR